MFQHQSSILEDLFPTKDTMLPIYLTIPRTEKRTLLFLKTFTRALP